MWNSIGAADFAIFHVRRSSASDRRAFPIARRVRQRTATTPRAPRAKVPARLQTGSSHRAIDTLRVEARDPPPQALEFGGLASFSSAISVHYAGAWRAAIAALKSRTREDTPGSMVRAGTVLLCAAAATSLAGCAGEDCRRMRGGPHPGRRMEAESHRQRRPADSAGPDARRGLQAHGSTSGGRTAPQRTRGTRTSPRGSAARGRSRPGARPTALPAGSAAAIAHGSCPAHEIARGDLLTVRQGPGEFAVDYGTWQRSFTPGARSVYRPKAVVADQTSAEGPEYVIPVRAQLGRT